MIQPPMIGPSDRADHRADAEDRHRHAVLLRREGLEQDRLADRDQAAAGEPLEDAEEDQALEAQAEPQRKELTVKTTIEPIW